MVDGTELKKIVLTGGGTAGHVMPHIALLDEMQMKGWKLHYIGSYRGIERELITERSIRYSAISTGKLRRYFSWQNFLDVFKVLIGTLQAFFLLLRIRPNAVFSKGGFVSVPVAVAAWFLRIPVVTHESDRSPGLANRIILRFAKSIGYSFPDTARYIPTGKGYQCKAPVRKSILKGDAILGLKHCQFDLGIDKPVVLVMGGSLGATRLNELVFTCLDELKKHVRVIHITGKGKQAQGFQSDKDYAAFEYVGAELANLFACSRFVIARAGANSLFEFQLLQLPMILLPLEIGSRGDQLENARYFESLGIATILRETQVDSQQFLRVVLEQVASDCSQMRESYLNLQGAAQLNILELIEKAMSHD